MFEKKGKPKKARDLETINNPVDRMNIWEKVFAQGTKENLAGPFKYDNPNTCKQAPEALGIPSYSEYNDFQSLCRESVEKLTFYTLNRVTTSETSRCVCF